MTRAPATRFGPFGIFRVPSAAEKKALVRVTRVTYVGIALMLLLMVLGQEYAWLFGLLIGLALVAYGALALRRAVAVRSWLRVPGRVVATSIGEVVVPSKYSSHTHYYPVVEVEYATPRGRFTSDRYGIAPQDPRSLHPDDTRALLARYAPGTDVQLYVDPDDHATAVVHPHVSRRRRSQYLAAIVGGLLVCGLTAWLVWPL